jgi:SEL1 protein
MIGLFYSTGLGGIEEDQGKVSRPGPCRVLYWLTIQALLYYTFSALQGYRPAEMALGYRHWAGVSVQEVSRGS